MHPSSSLLRLGLIGCGHWGPNYLRVFQQLPGAEMHMAADLNAGRREALQQQFPAVEFRADAAAILNHPALDAVVIATPASGHYPLVKQALEAGKHVLCEKPLTLNAAESLELNALAAARERILMVGHTFLFNSGIRQLKTYLTEGLPGQLYYLHATRTNLGPIRTDVGAIADLASHDIAIFNYLLESLPLEVSARALSCLPHSHEDLAFITLTYPQQVVAHAHISWLNPVKVRQMTLVGSKKMITWDDIHSEPIRIFDAGVTPEPYYQDFGQYQLLPKQGDTLIPRLSMTEPLKTQAAFFLEAIREARPPFSDGVFAAGVVQVLEAIHSSIAQGGAPVQLSLESQTDQRRPTTIRA
jgi:predicted dehydrogenase